MFDEFRKGNFKISVGARLKGESDYLLKYVSDFAAFSKAKLRLVNVVEPWKEHPWISTLPGENLYYSIAQKVEERARENAEGSLKEIAGKLADPKSIETAVLQGGTSDAITADAVTARSSLICVASEKKEGLHLLSGFTTGLELAANSNIPVMIVPNDRKEFKPKGRLKVMYADDLAANSLGALCTAVELAYGLGEIDFYHVHVSGESKEEMASAGEKILDLMNMEQIDINPYFDINSLTDDVENKFKKKMSERVGFAKSLLNSRDVEYIQQTKFGEVKDGMDELVKEIDPDIVIFGRHHFIHRNPLGIGKLAFSAMLSYDRPVIIAPGEKRLQFS
jgi:nucleotide-binding universal stress UspA family protein